MPRVLTAMEITEVSAVRKAAGEGTKIIFQKNDTQQQLDQIAARLRQATAPQNRAAGLDGAQLHQIAERKRRAGKKARGAAEVEKAEYEPFTKTRASERFLAAGIARRKGDDAGVLIVKQNAKKKIKAAEKRAKKAKKEAEKEAKKKAKVIARDRRRADEAAMIRNTTLNKDLINVCKSIITGGADRQPGLTSRDLYIQLQRRSAAVRKDGQTAEQTFAKYATEDPDGKLLFAAMRKAKQVPWDQTDEDEEDEKEEAGTDPYRKFMAKVSELRKAYSGLSEAQIFARLYGDPANRRLADADKEAHVTKIAKRIGLR
jgi:hypothetical protein